MAWAKSERPGRPLTTETDVGGRPPIFETVRLRQHHLSGGGHRTPRDVLMALQTSCPDRRGKDLSVLVERAWLASSRVDGDHLMEKAGVVVKPGEVRVTNYDSAWTEEFEHEARAVRAAMGLDAVTVHHIGSTAVPGLAAKPIIDMLPVVEDDAALDRVSPRLTELGYESLGEFGLPGRRYFRKGRKNRTHHLHCYAVGNPEIYRHLAFRDYLCAKAEVRNDYDALKRCLARQFPRDMDAYIAGKDKFVKEIERTALTWWEPVPLILISGPVGVGKSTVADAVSHLTPMPVWMMDWDRLTDVSPASPDDRFHAGVARAGLARLWPVMRSAGVRVVVVPRVLEHLDDVVAVAAAVPGAIPYVVRLRAEIETLHQRLVKRECGAALAWHEDRAQELSKILDRARIDDVVVDTDGKTVDDVVAVVVDHLRMRFADVFGPS